MNSNNYQITIPYSDFLKYQKTEQELKTLKNNIIDAFNPNDEIGEITMNVTEIKQLCKTLLPMRYQDYNYVEVH